MNENINVSRLVLNRIPVLGVENIQILTLSFLGVFVSNIAKSPDHVSKGYIQGVPENCCRFFFGLPFFIEWALTTFIIFV